MNNVRNRETLQHVENQSETSREQFSRLFLDDPQYAPVAQQILDSVERGDQTAKPYISILPGLLNASSEFAAVFPEEIARGVAVGSKGMISDALYAVAHHTEHSNTTSAAIELRGGKQLAVEYAGSQPAELLMTLSRTMRRITQVVVDPEVPVVTAVRAPGFRIYRFLDHRRPGMPAVHAYVRPEGSEEYDRMYEYGRPGKGVEASVSFVVDTRSGEAIAQTPFMSEITKDHHGPRPDNRISLRLDREGVRPEERELLDGFHHPRLQDGTLAYDAGSVLGTETFGTLPLGTRVGRLLAWGNTLSRQASGRIVGLNHSVEEFDGILGRDDVFALHALSMEEAFCARTISRQSVAKLLGRGSLEHGE